METKAWQENLQQSVQQTTNMDNGNNLLDNSNNNIDKKNKNIRLEHDLNSTISENGRQKIQTILEQVNQLIPIEKLLLYLKLPSENSSVNADPLRQSLNPLGGRSEISQTIMWIQTHLEEDKELSLQKKGVYDDYVMFCEQNAIKPLSTADFGKVMKQVYPNVRPRRLGTRGQSKYCYSGLRSRIKLGTPLLPDLADKPMSSEVKCTQSDLMAAAWIILKEWAEVKLSIQFKSIIQLAYYLINELQIGVGTDAANLITKSHHLNNDNSLLPALGYMNKHKETTMQLQRKLQLKQEGVKESKRKQSPRTEQRTRGKRLKSISATSCSTSPVTTTPIIATASTLAANDVDNKQSPQQSQEHSPVCDSNTNLQTTLPDFNCFQRPTTNTTDTAKDAALTPTALHDFPHQGKVAIPRITNTHQKQLISSPLAAKRLKNNNKYKAIQPKPDLLCDRETYKQSNIITVARSQQESTAKRRLKKKTSTDEPSPPPPPPPASLITAEESNSLFSRERLISMSQVSKDALDEYLGTSNSQEQEEELLQYFQAPSDQVNNTLALQHQRDQEKSKKISQLRQLLEKNCTDVQNDFKINLKGIIPPPIINTKRRVSFDTHDVVPPSPNTRRQNINFIPISPQSPKSSSSPFVSPRNTPVPRLRGNSHPYVSSQQTQRQLITKSSTAIQNKGNFLDNNQLNIIMSAPPSPKNAFFNNKYQNMTQNFNEGDLLMDNVAFRSQSVPTTQFPNQFSSSTVPSAFNEFNDIDLNVDLLGFMENQPAAQKRSQSIDIETSVVDYGGIGGVKFPSRSVPNTPIPGFTQTNLDISKSYPNTPLTCAEDAFTYNQTQDFLLNGQPIKDKLTDFVDNGGDTTDNSKIFDNYNDGDLIDNKNFHFEENLNDEGHFGATKQNINDTAVDFL